MPKVMINYPDRVWTQSQQIENLRKISYLFNSQVFSPSTPFTSQSQAHWLELIRSVSDLVRQASLAGQRINFTNQVSVQGQARDITSLLDRMRQSAFLISSIAPAHRNLIILSHNLNYVAGVGTGQFANGLLYSCPYPNELAFFIGQDRIYFYRHLMRAYLEASRYLTSRPNSF